MTIIAVLIFVALPDAELARKPHTRDQHP